MIRLLLVAGVCAAAGLAQAQSLSSAPSSAPIMSGSIDAVGDMTLRSEKYNMTLPAASDASAQGVNSSAITGYGMAKPPPVNRAKPKRWTFDGPGQSKDQRYKPGSAESYVQDDFVGGHLDVDGYDNFSVDPGK